MQGGIGLVLDGSDVERLAAFWSAALGYTEVGRAGTYLLLLDPDRVGPKLLLQHVDKPKAAKNRMHLDIDVADVDAEVARLEGLGACRLREPQREHGSYWVVMADPEGNEFCVCDAGQGGGG